MINNQTSSIYSREIVCWHRGWSSVREAKAQPVISLILSKNIHEVNEACGSFYATFQDPVGVF